MREKLNSNPVFQVVFVGVLLVVVGFVFMTRVMKHDPASTASTTGDTTATATAVPATATAVPGATDPAAAASGAAIAAPAPAATPAPAEEAPFKAGPGLPKSFVDSYESGDTVALLVSGKHGSDDKAMRKTVTTLHSRSGVKLFTVDAHDVARYSRIAEGVDLDRVPALVVVQPKRLVADGSMPTATVSYGYRGPQSVDQAVFDAGYSGKVHDYSP